MPTGHGGSPAPGLQLPLTSEEISHLEVIFSSLSRSGIVPVWPARSSWVWASGNRRTSWGSSQEMFILYFKISFKKNDKKKDILILEESRVQNRLN